MTTTPSEPVISTTTAPPVRQPTLKEAHAAWLAGVRPADLGDRAIQWKTHEAFMAWALEKGWKHYGAVADRMIWRFTSLPASEVVVIDAEVPITMIVDVIGKHSGGADKSNKNVRTSSLCRSVGALMGTAASGGGDKKVLNIINSAEYLCGIDVTAIADHGVSAHPALSRMISLFETEYVLVSTPGNAGKSIATLATHIYKNPFKGKIEASGKVGDYRNRLTIKDPHQAFGTTDTTVTPEVVTPTGVMSAEAVEQIILTAKKSSEAASEQAGNVRMKEGELNEAMMTGAMRLYLAKFKL